MRKLRWSCIEMNLIYSNQYDPIDAFIHVKSLFEDNLKYEDDLEYGDDLKYEDSLKYEDNLIYEDDLEY